ncbi:T-cell surface glycoprotein CD8 alpha chain [Mantella aurantiaca]
MHKDVAYYVTSGIWYYVDPQRKELVYEGSQHLKLQGSQLQRGKAQNVKLECSAEAGDFMDQGVYWFRQKKNEKIPQGIVFLNMVGRASNQNDPNASKFKPDKSGNTFTLTTNLFHDADQGTYYCMINKNSVLTFSPGLQLFYPEVTTHKPTSTKPFPVTPTQVLKSGDDCDCSSGKTGSSDKKDGSWKIDCDTYIWLPLAGLSGFLLLCLLVTAIMLCGRTRRRRCRCKHRPLDEKNGQMNPMNKY